MSFATSNRAVLLILQYLTGCNAHKMRPPPQQKKGELSLTGRIARCSTEGHLILLLSFLPFSSAGILSRYLAPLRPVSSRHSLDEICVAIADVSYFLLYRSIYGAFL